LEFVGDLIVPERKTFLKQRSIVFVLQKFEEHKMATHSRVEVTPGTEGVPDEMMAELKKEIARNVEATKLVKQREMEATHARDMAADSQRRMQEMMDKYEEMKNKLEWTRLTLAETHSRLEKHNNSRSERLRQSVMELKEKAELTQQRLLQRSQGSAAAASEEVRPETSMPDASAADPMAALGALGGMDSSAGGLTDAERMLLQMCQEQRKSADSVIEPEVPKKVEEEEDEEEPSQRLKNASRDYAKTVLDLQKKLSSSSKPSSSSSPTNTGSQEDVSNSQPVSTESNSKTEEITSTAPVVVETAMPEQVRETAVADHVERATSAAEESAVELAAAVAEAVAVQSPSSDEVNALASAAAEVDGLEMDLKMDLNVEKVAQMEAKVASVRETLGEMAMSEQYMRTKRAQLLARTREREAQLAMQLAEEKEKEAAEMRHKVKHMMLLLDERRNKLMATVDVLQKKSGVVEKVNKLLDSKERRANYVEKQRDECLAFDKKPKKN